MGYFPISSTLYKETLSCVVGVMKENDIFLQTEMVSFCSPVLCVLNVRWRYLVADTCTKANGVLGPA